MGMLYLMFGKGQGVEKDIEKAKSWKIRCVLKAVDMGIDPESLFS